MSWWKCAFIDSSILSKILNCYFIVWNFPVDSIEQLRHFVSSFSQLGTRNSLTVRLNSHSSQSSETLAGIFFCIKSEKDSLSHNKVAADFCNKCSHFQDVSAPLHDSEELQGPCHEVLQPVSVPLFVLPRNVQTTSGWGSNSTWTQLFISVFIEEKPYKRERKYHKNRLRTSIWYAIIDHKACHCSTVHSRPFFNRVWGRFICSCILRVILTVGSCETLDVT